MSLNQMEKPPGPLPESYYDVASVADNLAGAMGADIHSRQVLAVMLAMLEHIDSLERRLKRLENAAERLANGNT